MQSQNLAADCLVISYLQLRRAIGIIGTALPFALVAGKWLVDGWGIQSSISAYYYTGVRDVLVGSLCAIGVFLLSYRGYERADELAGNLACVFAVGVALFPTAPSTGASGIQAFVGYVHLVFASAFFLTLAYFSLVLFRKTNPAKRMTPRKKQRNVIYAVCGYTILACIGLVVVDFAFLKDSVVQTVDPVFWLESAAVLAFGISWLTKGEAILADVATPAVTGAATKRQEASRGASSARRGVDSAGKSRSAHARHGRQR